MLAGAIVWFRSVSTNCISDLRALDFVVNRLFMKLFKCNGLAYATLIEFLVIL